MWIDRSRSNNASLRNRDTRAWQDEGHQAVYSLNDNHVIHHILTTEGIKGRDILFRSGEDDPGDAPRTACDGDHSECVGRPGSLRSDPGERAIYPL